MEAQYKDSRRHNWGAVRSETVGQREPSSANQAAGSSSSGQVKQRAQEQALREALEREKCAGSAHGSWATVSVLSVNEKSLGTEKRERILQKSVGTLLKPIYGKSEVGWPIWSKDILEIMAQQGHIRVVPTVAPVLAFLVWGHATPQTQAYLQHS